MRTFAVYIATCALAQVFASRPVSHVHLAMTSDATQLNLQWYSADGDVLGNGTSTVQYGLSPHKLDQTAIGYNWTYTDTSSLRSYTFHGATLSGLTPGESYFYRVGDPLDGWSPVYSCEAVRTADQMVAEPMVVGVLGDMGWADAQALTYLQTEVAQGKLPKLRT